MNSETCGTEQTQVEKMHGKISERALFKGMDGLVGNFPSSLSLLFERKVVSRSSLERHKADLKKMNIILISHSEITETSTSFCAVL